MARNFVVLAEIVPRTFVVLARIEAVSRPPTRLAKILHSESTAWEEHYEARRKYNKALEVWRQAENLVNLNTQRTASACHDTADSAFETAHHLRKSLSRVRDDRIEMSELVEVEV